MSTHVLITKKPSGHDLIVQVKNPGYDHPVDHLLQDGESIEVMVHGGDAAEGGGTITLSERDKSAA